MGEGLTLSTILVTLQLELSATHTCVPSVARPVGWPGRLPWMVRTWLPSAVKICSRSLPLSATSTPPSTGRRKRGLFRQPSARPHAPKLVMGCRREPSSRSHSGPAFRGSAIVVRSPRPKSEARTRRAGGTRRIAKNAQRTAGTRASSVTTHLDPVIQ